MPWIEVQESFRWSPPERRGNVTIVYKPGRYLVTTPCAEAAIAAGKAVNIATQRRRKEKVLGR
jgi:hypothetical protein